MSHTRVTLAPLRLVQPSGGGALLERVTIVDDHGVVAHTLAVTLTSRGVEVTIVEPSTAEDLVVEATATNPDLVLLDLDLGEAGDATELIAPLVDRGAQVVMLTGVTDPVRRAACVAAGALGIVDKASGFDRLVDVLHGTITTGRLLSDHAREEHLALLREHRRAQRARLEDFEALSPREAHVLGELIQGASVDDVARTSVVSVATVRSQVRAILRKLGAPSQVAAIGRARAAAWVPPQER